MASVAPALQRLPEDLEFDCLRRGYVEHSLDHRQLNQLTAPGVVGVFECGE
jgi:hypothetical protein